MQQQATEHQHRLQRGRRQIALIWGGVALLLIAVSPFGPWLIGGLGACPFKTLTGIPCPTCGTTRAALALAEFRWLDALVLYPLPTLGWLALIGGGLSAGALALAGRDLPGLPRRIPLWLKISILSILGMSWWYSWQTGV